ncbi:MMPL family transporter [Halobacteria archaeon AArc-curdl1]|uniref:MMPL family transporter n=1 Tax=Natronosalvus hydrolyticus TaxID=2979988 RepID=A0AAP2Z739_9EURY|nr:MMPL family transporter [Halobacteria archaeon AArc-curdl1]
MPRDVARQFTDFVTTHNRLVIVVMVVLTAGVGFGIAQDQGDVDEGIDDDSLGNTDVYDALEYIENSYGESERDDESTVTTDVYVIADDGSTLERETLLTALEYQKQVLEAESVREPLTADGIDGVPNRVAITLLEEPDADLEAQYDALESASDEELEGAIAAVLAEDEFAAFYLSATADAGESNAEAFRMTFEFEESAGDPETGSPAFEIEQELFETAGAYESPAIYVDGQPVWAELNQRLLSEIAWLVIPAVLALLLVILGFAYRDLTDVLIGFAGTVVALVWTAGLMGWMGLLNQTTAIIAPILVAALSIDFGFHVFMRYRERRGPEDPIRDSLRRSTAAVAVAFVLVTVTAVIGFLSNQFSPVALIRDLGVAITLGVVASLLIFTTLVPALKVSADGLWERFGYDRRKTALGKGRHISRVLEIGVTLARRAPIAVIALVLVAGLVGGLAFADLEREAWQQFDPDDVPDWQTELPGPMAVETHESPLVEQMEYVQTSFQTDQEGLAAGGAGYTTMLVTSEDEDAGIATSEGMAALERGHERASEADEAIVLSQNGEVRVISVLTVMEMAAAENESFAATLEAADTNGDGVPDRDVDAVFDELYEVEPEAADAVLERTDDGQYESMLVQVPATQTYGSDRAAVMNDIAGEMAADSDLEVTAVGPGTINEAEMGEIADGIVWTLLLALAGVLIALSIVYRLVHGSFTLGAITVIPIALALGFVFGGMYLVGQPLTMVTALLVSITIGLGIDYNIHLSDRFCQELERGQDTVTALREAVTGTGGALLGSAITSGGAFSLLILVPEPQLTSFGVIVALALGVSFLLSVFVLPSLLILWAQRTDYGLSSGSSPRAEGGG